MDAQMAELTSSRDELNTLIAAEADEGMIQALLEMRNDLDATLASLQEQQQAAAAAAAAAAERHETPRPTLGLYDGADVAPSSRPTSHALSLYDDMVPARGEAAVDSGDLERWQEEQQAAADARAQWQWNTGGGGGGGGGGGEDSGDSDIEVVSDDGEDGWRGRKGAPSTRKAAGEASDAMMGGSGQGDGGLYEDTYIVGAWEAHTRGATGSSGGAATPTTPSHHRITTTPTHFPHPLPSRTHARTHPRHRLEAHGEDGLRPGAGVGARRDGHSEAAARRPGARGPLA